MDYGKMAYLKAEDIEARLSIKKPAAAITGRIVANTLSSTPIELFAVEAGTYILLLTFAGGQNSLTVHIGSDSVALNAGYQGVLFFNAATSAKVSVTATGSAGLQRADIMAIGASTVSVL